MALKFNGMLRFANKLSFAIMHLRAILYSVNISCVEIFSIKKDLIY
ncbi:MAG: hypothetical protein LBQ34_01245 [Alphaproteobacteria bacterium]|nr:hypothetical protein [Alphaproteobacteria bacterium]